MRVAQLSDVYASRGTSRRLKRVAREYEMEDPTIAAMELEALAEIFRHRLLKLEKPLTDWVRLV